jgi:hypothetical protein
MAGQNAVNNQGLLQRVKLSKDKGEIELVAGYLTSLHTRDPALVITPLISLLHPSALPVLQVFS